VIFQNGAVPTPPDGVEVKINGVDGVVGAASLVTAPAAATRTMRTVPEA
jgi:hypothetical protein